MRDGRLGWLVVVAGVAGMVVGGCGNDNGEFDSSVMFGTFTTYPQRNLLTRDIFYAII